MGSPEDRAPTSAMPVTEVAAARFAHLVSLPEEEIPLDEASILLGAHAHPDLDPAAGLSCLDSLAAGCPGESVNALVRHLFVDEGFRGNTDDYYDPANSFLTDVLDRRVGIPISLAVLMIEVGRRVGLRLAGVNMPGHFLVRTLDGRAELLDPYGGGRRISYEECEALYAAAAPRGFDPRVLEPVGARVVLGRMLRNLAAVARQQQDAPALAWALQLRTSIPGGALTDRYEYAGALAAAGRFDEAADIYEEVAARAEGEAVEKLTSKASRMRARLN